MKILTLLNEKGGVGKTTLATHIATGLAIRGLTVVLVDADPQGHATMAVGLRRAPGLYNLLIREDSFKDVLQRIPPEHYGIPGQPVTGELYVVPSNLETRAIPMMTSDGLIVLKRFRELENVADVVVFDTSPTPSLLHAAIYMATHYIVYPTECEYLSLDGLVQSLSHKDQVQPTRQQWGLSNIEVMGIVPMKFRAKTILHKRNLQSMKQRFGEKVWPAVALRTIWGEASLMRRPVFHLAPDSLASADAWKIVRRVEEAI